MELDTIFNQDCMDGLKLLPDKSIDLIVTDPPYGKLDIITIGTEALKMRRWAERLAEVKGGDPDA